jgi:transcriptional regulator with XRE-family HTH domain
MPEAQVSPIHIRIQELREAKGWSQAELGRRSGVTQATISRLESGETGSIALANLERLADALGVNAAALIAHEPASRRGR